MKAVCTTHGGLYSTKVGCSRCNEERERRPPPARERGDVVAVRVRNSRKWARIRRLARIRDGGRCTWGTYDGDRGVAHYPDRRCPVTRGLEGHHIDAIEDGGEPYDLDNVRTLCGTHHERAESERRRAA